MEFLRGEVHNVSKGLDSLSTNLSTQISELGKNFNSSGKPNWVVIGTFVSVAVLMIGAFWQISKSPLEMSIARNESAIRELKSDFRDSDRETNKTITTIHGLIVPRGEHEKIWHDGDRRLDALEKEVKEIRRDAMASTVRRLEQLRGEK